MILHLDEAKAALKQQPARVFTEEALFKVCSSAGMVLTNQQSPRIVLRDLGFNKALIKTPYRQHLLYYWPEATIYEIAQALNPRAYLAQLAALGFHGLASKPLKHLVVNEEQSVKLQSVSRLSQNSIDNAFSRNPRVSNNVGVWNNNGQETFFYLTNSKNSKQLGVIEASCGPTTIRVTNVARTLLDCAVRAFYGGDPQIILEAYRRACEKFDVKDLVSEIVELLAQISHKYPYHQAIGFYFEKACPNLSIQILNPLRELGLNFDFYLTYQMEEPLFDKDWRIYYPTDLK